MMKDTETEVRGALTSQSHDEKSHSNTHNHSSPISVTLSRPPPHVPSTSSGHEYERSEVIYSCSARGGQRLCTDGCHVKGTGRG